MKPAWRGVVVDGEVWAWPTELMDHETAFRRLPFLRDYSCRWRQWSPNGPIDFDYPCTQEDRIAVGAWVMRAQA